MRKKGLIEFGKSLLIIALAISALKLSGTNDLMPKLFDSETHSSEASEVADGQISQMSKPLSLVVTSSENAHYGVKYDAKGIGDTYADFTAALGEALGSAGEPVLVDTAAWESAIGQSGVFFDYIYSQPISAASKWLGVEISGVMANHSARRFCLAVEGDSIAIYYDCDDGEFYRCSSALSSDSFIKIIDKYVPNGAMFSFELDDYKDVIDPYYLVLNSATSISNLSATNSIASMDSEDLLGIFDIELMVTSSYGEADGTQVYIEGDKSLRIAPDGQLQFNNLGSEQIGSGEILSVLDILTLTSRLVSNLPISCDTQLSYVLYDSATNEYTVRLEYVYDGIVVAFAGRTSAIELRFMGSGEIEFADIICRDYSATDTAIVMPERQALALVIAKGGGEPMLAYTDYGDVVGFDWTILN